jgi:hypothetical protein
MEDDFFAGPSTKKTSFLSRLHDVPHDDFDDVFGVPPPAARNVDVAMGHGQLIPDDLEEATPTQKLMRYWINERSAPEVLQCQTEVLNEVLDFIAEQVGEFTVGSLCETNDI